MKKTTILITLLLFIIGGAWFGIHYYLKSQAPETQNDSTLSKIKIGMGYIPNVQFVPFYVAQDLGYYREVSLDVAFDYAMSPDLLKLLGQNALDFVVASGDEVVVAADKEVPVTYVMTLYSKFPVAITSLSETKIEKAEDLKGKKVGIPVFYGSSYIGLEAFLRENGLTNDDLKLEAIGYTQVQALTEKREDAVVVFSMNEPVQINDKGFAINTLELSNDIDLASAGIVTGNKKIEQSPQEVQNFVNATYKGMLYAKSHSEEAFTIVKKYVEISYESATIQYHVMQKAMEFWGDGKLNRTTWQNTIDTLYDQELIESKQDISAYANTQFSDSL